MSRSTRTSRQGSLVQTAGALIQSLIRQPVKSAVREALAEDRATTQDQPTAEPGTMHGSTERPSTGSSGGGAMRKMLLLGAIAGAIYYATRQRGIDIQDELSEEMGVGDAGMRGQGSTEDPLSSESSPSEERTDRETDEGPTTRS